jgi:quinone-modifying oxidoreductase subunit QmoA
MAEPQHRSVHRSIVVVGAGISGISAAVEAAEAGYEATLVERNPYLGGRVAQHNKYFPKLCSPTCGLEINFQRIKKNPRLRFLTMAEVESISGRPGDFDVTVKQHPRYVNDRCTSCNACTEACPETRADAYNLGMSTTKAIYLPHAMAFPMKYVIDDRACKLEACGKCVDACRYGAIDLAMKPRSIRLKAGAVIMATGWNPYDAARIDNLGFGQHADIITNMMMERLCAANGPTGGRLVRPSDGREVKRIAFVQCAGSRDALHLGYCSAICCLASLKQASYVFERYPDAEVTIFYIDLRTPGGYDAFSRKVQASGKVTLIKGKVAKIVGSGSDLVVEAEDILALTKRRVAVDMVVLASGMAAALDNGKPQADIAFDADHFVVADNTAPGIYATGCARGPVDVATAVQDATAAAMKAIGAIQSAARGLVQ